MDLNTKFDWRKVLAQEPRTWRKPPAGSTIEISTFEDEAGELKTKPRASIWQTAATHGLRRTSARFIDTVPAAGGPAQTMHVDQFSPDQVAQYVAEKSAFGLTTHSMGGRGGKVYADDDSAYVWVKEGGNFVRKTWKDYLDSIKRDADTTRMLGTILYRGFALYRRVDAAGNYIEPRGVRRSWAKDRVGEMATAMKKAGVFFGVEWEANLEYGNGWEVAELVKELDLDNLLIVPDLGNMGAWGYTVNDIVDMFLKSVQYLVWLHLKDYSWFGGVPNPAGGALDEHALEHFCACDVGRSGHYEVFSIIAKILPYLNARAIEMGLPGFCVELEPHLWGGGQFGGLSRHEGIGIAMRGLLRVLAASDITPVLRSAQDILDERRIV